MFRMYWRQVLGALLIALCFAQVAEARKWTSRDGAFSIEAELVDFQDGKVTLKRGDGKIVAVPLDKLSLGDTLYVQEALQALGRDLRAEQAKSAPKPMAPAPMPTTPMPTTPMPAENQPDATPGDDQGPPLTKPDGLNWQVAPDPPLEALKLPANHTLQLPIQSDGGRPIVLYPHAVSPFVMLGGESSDAVRKVFDLRTGEAVGQIREKIRSSQHASLSPNGKRFACMSSDTRDGVQVWSLTTGKLDRKLTLPKEYASVQFLSFAGNDRVVATVIGEKTLFVWNLHTGDTQAKIPVDGLFDKDKITVSPGGHYIALATKSTVDFYDVRNGEFAGSVDMDKKESHESVSAMSFSHDGSELAVIIGSDRNPQLCSWDLAKGEANANHQLKDLPYAGSYDGQKLEWFADKSGWLIHGVSVVDRNAGGPLYVNADKSVIYKPHIRYVDAQRMLIAEGDRKALKLRLVDIPKDKYQAGAKVVASGGTAEDAALPPLVVPDVSTIPVVNSFGAEYKYKPRATKLATSVDATKPWNLPRALYKEVLFGTPDSGRVVLGWSDNSGRREDRKGPILASNTLQVYDLAQRRAVNTFEVPFPTGLKAVSANGNCGAFQIEQTNDRIDIYDLTNGKHVGGFRPYEQLDAKNKGVEWIGYSGDNMLITLSQWGTLVGWQLPGFKPLYRLEVGHGGRVALDQSRQVMAVSAPGKQTILLGAAQGEILGTLEAPTAIQTRIVTSAAFSADGSRLAATCFNDSGVTVVEWDLTNGSIKSQRPFGVSSRSLSWVGPRQVLLHNTSDREVTIGGRDANFNQCSLLDLDRGAIVWTYQHEIGGLIRETPNDQHWYCTTTAYGEPASLVAMTLPDPKAAEWIRGSAGIKPIVDTGSNLALKVELEGNFPVSSDEKVNRATQLSNEISQHLADSLADQKVKISADADARMIVKMQEKTETAAIELRSRIGRPSAILRVSITAIPIRIEIRNKAGEMVWEKSHLIGVDELRNVDVERRPDNMTTENYVRQEQWKAAVAWTRKLVLPVPLYEFSASAGLGESTLLPSGAKATRTPAPAKATDKRT